MAASDYSVLLNNGAGSGPDYQRQPETVGHSAKLIYFGHLVLAGGGTISPAAILLAIAAALLRARLILQFQSGSGA